MNMLINQSLSNLKSSAFCPMESQFPLTPLLNISNEYASMVWEHVNAYLSQFPPSQILITAIAIMSVTSVIYPRVSNFIAIMTFTRVLEHLIMANLTLPIREYSNPEFLVNIFAILLVLIAHIYASAKYIRKTC